MGQKKALWILGALVLLLGLSYAAVLWLSSPEQTHVHEDESPLLQVEKESVTKIEFTTPAEALSLELSDGFWQIAADSSFPLDQDIPKNMIAVLAPLTPLREVSASPADATLYGFDSPVTVCVTDSKGTYRFLLGKECEAIEGYYLRTSEASPVYLVPLSVGIAFCHEDRYDLILMDPYPSVDTDDMQRITLRSPQGNKVLYREEKEGKWLWETNGESKEAPEDTAQTVMELISSLKFSSCVGHNYDESQKLSLFPEGYGFTVEYLHHGTNSAGEEVVTQLSFDFTVENTLFKESYYRANVSTSSQISLVDAETIKALWKAIQE